MMAPPQYQGTRGPYSSDAMAVEARRRLSTEMQPREEAFRGSRPGSGRAYASPGEAASESRPVRADSPQYKHSSSSPAHDRMRATSGRSSYRQSLEPALSETGRLRDIMKRQQSAPVDAVRRQVSASGTSRLSESSSRFHEDTARTDTGSLYDPHMEGADAHVQEAPAMDSRRPMRKPTSTSPKRKDQRPKGPPPRIPSLGDSARGAALFGDKGNGQRRNSRSNESLPSEPSRRGVVSRAYCGEGFGCSTTGGGASSAGGRRGQRQGRQWV